MRDSKRIPAILEKINKIWNQYPDLRFFQVIEIIKSKSYKVGYQSSDMFYFEDDDLDFILETEFDL